MLTSYSSKELLGTCNLYNKILDISRLAWSDTFVFTISQIHTQSWTFAKFNEPRNLKSYRVRQDTQVTIIARFFSKENLKLL